MDVENLELCWRERGRLWLRLGVRLILVALAVLAIAYVVPPLAGLFMPFLLALVMAWLLNPLIKAIQKRVGISRKILALVLIFLLFAVVGGALTALVYNIVAELASLVSNWPVIWENTLKPAIGNLEFFFSELFAGLPAQVSTAANEALNQLVAWLNSSIPAFMTRMGPAVGSFAFSIPSFVMSSVIFVMASFFITSDYPRLRFLFLDKLSAPLHGFLSDVKRTAVAAFGGYVKAQLILSVVVFTILLIGFLVIGQPYAVLLAFLLAIMDFVPIIGSGTAMVPWAVVSLFIGDYRQAIQLMVIWGLIALFRQLAEPKIVGDQTGLSPIMSLVSIYVGMKLGGIPGMIFGPVLCMVVINICKLGVLNGVSSDLKLAAGDISALLKNRPEPAEKK